MEWLADNWLWILVGIGLVWFMSRGHAGIGCCGAGHSHGIPPKKARSRNRERSQLRRLRVLVTEVGRAEKANILAVDGLGIKVRRK